MGALRPKGVRCAEGVWGNGRMRWDWWFRRISPAMVHGMNWRLKRTNKGNSVWRIWVCKAQEQVLLHFSTDVWNQKLTQEPGLVLSNIVQSNLRSRPHPETPGCPEQPVHRSKGKGIELHWEDGCCYGAEPPRRQTMKKVLALHKHITTFSGIQRHLSHFLGKLYLAPFQFRVAFLLS